MGFVWGYFQVVLYVMSVKKKFAVTFSNWNCETIIIAEWLTDAESWSCVYYSLNIDNIMLSHQIQACMLSHWTDAETNVEILNIQR